MQVWVKAGTIALTTLVAMCFVCRTRSGITCGRLCKLTDCCALHELQCRVRICLVDHTTVEDCCHSALQHNNTGILAILEASCCIRLSANSPACLQQLGFQAASPPFTLAHTRQSDATAWGRPYYCKNERYCKHGYCAVGGMDSR